MVTVTMVTMMSLNQTSLQQCGTLVCNAVCYKHSMFDVKYSQQVFVFSIHQISVQKSPKI